MKTFRDVVGAFLELDIRSRARVWCALNRFEWPRELANHKPDQWEIIPESERMKTADGARLWKAANEHTTHKECLREWNRDRMDDAQFEEWWGRTFRRNF
jgi:hypothetical protein